MVMALAACRETKPNPTRSPPRNHGHKTQDNHHQRRQLQQCPPLPQSGCSCHAAQERLHAGARRAARLLLLLRRRPLLPGRPLRRLLPLPDGRLPPAGHLLQPARSRRRRLGPRALPRPWRRPSPRVLGRQSIRTRYVAARTTTTSLLPPSGRSRPALETIQSFTARGYEEEEEDDDEDADQETSFGMFGGSGSTYTAQQEHPLFLARGLGIDRLGSGLLSGADGGSFDDGGSGGGGGGDRSGIKLHYKKLIEEDPCNGLFLRKYAQFLYQVKGDRRRAEEYYSRAILADPDDGELLSEYAKLVWEVHRDEERASSYFDRAARASPHNSHVLAAQAAFLWDTEDDDGAGPEPEEAKSYTGFAAAAAHPSMASATS